MKSNSYITIREGSHDPSIVGSQSNRDQLYRRFKKVHAYENMEKITNSQKNLLGKHNLSKMQSSSSKRKNSNRREAYQMPLKKTYASTSLSTKNHSQKKLLATTNQSMQEYEKARQTKNKHNLDLPLSQRKNSSEADGNQNSV